MPCLTTNYPSLCLSSPEGCRSIPPPYNSGPCLTQPAFDIVDVFDYPSICLGHLPCNGGHHPYGGRPIDIDVACENNEHTPNHTYFLENVKPNITSYTLYYNTHFYGGNTYPVIDHCLYLVPPDVNVKIHTTIVGDPAYDEEDLSVTDPTFLMRLYLCRHFRFASVDRTKGFPYDITTSSVKFNWPFNDLYWNRMSYILMNGVSTNYFNIFPTDIPIFLVPC